MRKLRAEFDAGQNLLSAYWNFLQAGGLVLPSSDSDPPEGETVLVEVHIRSIKKVYRLGARVARVHPDGRLFVCFLREQGQEAMVDAAWSDTYAVPERRHRRFEVRTEVRYAIDGRERVGQLANLSQGGCRLEVEERLEPGTPVYLVGIGLATVRWVGGAPSRAIGLQFLSPLGQDAEILQRVTG